MTNTGVAQHIDVKAWRTVRIVSKGLASTGYLMTDASLDANGNTISLLGCRSGIPGRSNGDVVLVTLTNRTIVPATITHIHKVHDRFRAVVDVRCLPVEFPRAETDKLGHGPSPVGDEVEVAEPR